MQFYLIHLLTAIPRDSNEYFRENKKYPTRNLSFLWGMKVQETKDPLD